MDIERARTFLQIIQSGSFQDAADRLHVTATTVSARIRTLEDEIGRQLFQRNRNGAQLTAAGREFERYAQSLVHIWERARQQLAVPAGKSSIVALGGELSLWDPLLLDWLVWMRKMVPEVAIRLQVGLAEQLLEQLRTGILDIAVVYAPMLAPGLTVRLLQEEKLVLVRKAGKQGAGAVDYVHVDWGPQFAAQYGSGTQRFGDPALVVNLGPLGLSYILRAGGMGYFRRSVADPYIENGELERVEGAPEFVYPVYAVYSENGEEREDIRQALNGLTSA
ncbi:MAG: LysR family transcriptional regulator [Rhizobiaceae bacterium]|nr:MAG: LysR family transcriptional regulator [Rhizobiaceae bacterium]